MNEDQERAFREEIANAINVTIKGLIAIHGDNPEILESMKLALSSLVEDFDHLYPY